MIANRVIKYLNRGNQVARFHVSRIFQLIGVSKPHFWKELCPWRRGRTRLAMSMDFASFHVMDVFNVIAE